MSKKVTFTISFSTQSEQRDQTETTTSICPIASPSNQYGLLESLKKRPSGEHGIPPAHHLRSHPLLHPFVIGPIRSSTFRRDVARASTSSRVNSRIQATESFLPSGLAVRSSQRAIVPFPSGLHYNVDYERLQNCSGQLSRTQATCLPHTRHFQSERPRRLESFLITLPRRTKLESIEDLRSDELPTRVIRLAAGAERL
jgi:hypothetical protein